MKYFELALCFAVCAVIGGYLALNTRHQIVKWFLAMVALFTLGFAFGPILGF